jgi:hypothetical protein
MKNLNSTIILIISLMLSVNSFAKVYETVKSGSWTNSSTWSKGQMPDKKDNNATIIINEGHNVVFSDNAANYKLGNNVKLDISGNLTIQGWGNFTIGNNAEINVVGSLTIPSNNRFTVGNGAEVNVYGVYNNNTNTVIGNNSDVTIFESGSLINTQSFTMGNNPGLIIEGLLINQSYKLDLGKNSAITVTETGSLINNSLFQAGDNFSLFVSGLLENDGWKFAVGSDTEVLISENGVLITESNMRFGDNLFMMVEGSLQVAGWAFYFEENSQLIVIGNMELDNHYVFQSKKDDNILYACDGSINEPEYAKNVTMLDCGTLPVELLYFDGRIVANNAELTWATATETNSDYFAVERSFDGFSWETISYVQSAGNSNQVVEYTFTDENLAEGIYYYRLKQVDFDGAMEYFAPIVVEMSATAEFQINRVEKTGEIVTLTANFEAGAQLVVFDAMGNIIDTEGFSYDSTTHSFRFSNESGIIVINYVNAITGVKSSSKYMVK